MDSTDVNPWGKPSKKHGGAGAHSNSGKLSKKMSQKFHKTKSVAASGAKIIKAGASSGVKWLKIKFLAHKLAKKK